MMDNFYGQDIDKDQFDREQQQSVFDDDVTEDIDSVQEPYPVNDIDKVERDNAEIKEVENPDENVHEYEDNDHPHEYKSPSAVIDNYKGSGGTDRTNAFEQQNPLQSTIPASERDS